MQRKEIHYYDSMSGSGKKYLEGMLRWLVDEAQNKQKIDNYDTSDWKTFDRERHVPQQRNGTYGRTTTELPQWKYYPTAPLLTTQTTPKQTMFV